MVLSNTLNTTQSWVLLVKMASPRLVVSALTKHRLSPRTANNFCASRKTLSPQTPNEQRSPCLQTPRRKRALPFSVDTPNRQRIISDGLSDEEKSLLGSGRFGVVHKAVYKGEQVAVKIIKRRKLSDTEVEAEKRASTLHHPNIVRVLGIEQGCAWSVITMELCDTSLQSKLEKTGLTKVERVKTWESITTALQFCHESGIIHADVKPKNVLLTFDGQTKLADFGSSIVIGGENRINAGLHGTPGYIAPEVIKGGNPSVKSDIYSLGVLAWQLLYREAPFVGYHPHTILYLTGIGIKPDNSNDDTDDECNGMYKRLYKKLWSENSQDRPNTSIIIDQLNILLQ